MLAVIDAYEREQTAEQLTKIGADLRLGIEQAVADAGLASHFQVRGRDCNLVYVARDADGKPSQEFRTLVLQELLERGILAPSFVVGAAHDADAIEQTIDAITALAPGVPARVDGRRRDGAPGTPGAGGRSGHVGKCARQSDGWDYCFG